MWVLRHMFTENTQSHPPPSTSHQNSSQHTTYSYTITYTYSYISYFSYLILNSSFCQHSPNCLTDCILWCKKKTKNERSALPCKIFNEIYFTSNVIWLKARHDMRLSTICSHIIAHNQLKSMPALSVCHVVFIGSKEEWFFVSVDFAVMWSGAEWLAVLWQELEQYMTRNTLFLSLVDVPNCYYL